MPKSRLCSVSGCGKQHAAKGFCFHHYYAWKTHGDPLVQKRLVPDTCTIEGCDKPHKGNGLCGMHLQRKRKHGDPLAKKTRDTCSIDGCEGKHRGQGYCSKHYQAWYLYGDPLAYHGTVRGTLFQYYAEVVLRHEADTCLFWPYGRSGRKNGGYAVMTTADRRKVYVHRAVCEAVNGPPPTPDHDATHTCGNGHLGCVAKRHQKWGTHVENMADKLLHGTHDRGERNHNARLTEDDVRQIRQLEGYLPQAQIGKMFGISREHARDIILRKKWSWLA